MPLASELHRKTKNRKTSFPMTMVIFKGEVEFGREFTSLTSWNPFSLRRSCSLAAVEGGLQFEKTWG